MEMEMLFDSSVFDVEPISVVVAMSGSMPIVFIYRGGLSIRVKADEVLRLADDLIHIDREVRKIKDGNLNS